MLSHGLQMSVKLRPQSHLLEWLKLSKQLTLMSAGADREQLGMQNGTGTLGNNFTASYSVKYIHSPYDPTGFPGGSDGKNPPAMWETWVRSLDCEDPMEEGMATHSSILAWRIP